ncbi:hypothetical protein SAMN03159341_1157 [Paenibacillus sp. 1_12]|uniref:DUF5348 domain-containing protein n=1 Tax=Paenibacillus sp. 1_12 TaxID=1566278 RepID=UPI0008F3DB8B|nr:DUF5348 domain-containing protein [Paenibacillus sp. 1_12]SFM05150.1 hypothetical protein SAMN03159341_1157 [Paenibacillus sp. 1_12]
MKRKIEMCFDPDQDRWYVELNGRNFGLHCGEGFDLYIGGEPFPCRLEMDRHYYIILKDVRFNLRKSDKYMVNV